MSTAHKSIAVNLLKNVVAHYFDCSFKSIRINDKPADDRKLATCSDRLYHMVWNGETLLALSHEFYQVTNGDDPQRIFDVVEYRTMQGPKVLSKRYVIYPVWDSTVELVTPYIYEGLTPDDHIAFANSSAVTDLNEFGQTKEEEAAEYDPQPVSEAINLLPPYVQDWLNTEEGSHAYDYISDMCTPDLLDRELLVSFQRHGGQISDKFIEDWLSKVQDSSKCAINSTQSTDFTDNLSVSPGNNETSSTILSQDSRNSTTCDEYTGLNGDNNSYFTHNTSVSYVSDSQGVINTSMLSDMYDGTDDEPSKPIASSHKETNQVILDVSSDDKLDEGKPRGYSLNQAIVLIEHLFNVDIQGIQYEDGSHAKFNVMFSGSWHWFFVDLRVALRDSDYLTDKLNSLTELIRSDKVKSVIGSSL